MTSIITRAYQGHAISYQDDGWFNATQAAAKFGKVPAEWLRLNSTIDYMAAMKRHHPDMGKTHIARKGGATGGATWLHPKLGVAFARWLDVDFAVWCDAQIDDLLRDKTDWRKLRHEAASTNKVMAAILQMTRAEEGKPTAAHHFSNESRLVNFILSGEFKSLNRDTLQAAELALLAHLEERNAVLIGRGISYEQRKPMLVQYAMDWRMARPALRSPLSTDKLEA